MEKSTREYVFLYKEPTSLAFSDAGATWCGSVITRDGEFACHKMWKVHERVKSSAWRELSAIEHVLESLTHVVLNASRVKWLKDNQTAAGIVDTGGI